MSPIILPQRENPLAQSFQTVSSVLLNKLLLDQQLQQQTQKVLKQRELESQSQQLLGTALGETLEEYRSSGKPQPNSYLENLVGQLDIKSKILKKIPEGMPIDKTLFDKLFSDVPIPKAPKEDQMPMTLTQELKEIEDQKTKALGNLVGLLKDPITPDYKTAMVAALNSKEFKSEEDVLQRVKDIQNEYNKYKVAAYQKRGHQPPEYLIKDIYEKTKGVGAPEIPGEDMMGYNQGSIFDDTIGFADTDLKNIRDEDKEKLIRQLIERFKSR